MPRLHQSGSTLIELLFVVALLALLLQLGLPAMGRLRESNAQQALADQLHGQLHYARASSVLHRRSVEICGSSDGLQCDGAWALGWRIAFAGSEDALSVQRLESRQPLHWSGMLEVIRFRSNGTTPMGNGRFYLCDSDGTLAWQLVLSRQGRIRRLNAAESAADAAERCD